MLANGNNQARKLANLTINTPMLKSFFHLPDSTEIVRVVFDHMTDSLVLTLQDEAFAEVAPGSVITNINAEYKNHTAIEFIKYK